MICVCMHKYILKLYILQIVYFISLFFFFHRDYSTILCTYVHRWQANNTNYTLYMQIFK